MHCEQCGAHVNPGARYCGSCGTPLVPDREPSPPLRERLRRLAGRTRRERTLTAGTAAALFIAVIGFILLDPTEESGDGGEPAPSAFVVAADRQCVAVKRQIATITTQSLGGTSSGSQARYVDDLLVAVLDWKVSLRELAATGAEASSVQEVSAALTDLAIEFGILARLSREGSASEIAAQAAAADDATGGVERAISDSGFDKCAQLTLQPVRG